MPVVPEISSSSTEHHISSKLPSNQHTQKNTKTHIHTHALLAGPHLRIQIWIDYSSYNQLLLVILPPSSFFASCSRKKKQHVISSRIYLLAFWSRFNCNPGWANQNRSPNSLNQMEPEKSPSGRTHIKCSTFSNHTN